VKRISDKIGKFLALSLMMIYLLISLSNLYFLPQYSRTLAANKTGMSTGTNYRPALLINGANNLFVFFHRTSKSIIEHRQKLAIFCKTATTVFLLVIFGGLTGLVLSRKAGFTNVLFLNRRTYLNFCSLRI